VSAGAGLAGLYTGGKPPHPVANAFQNRGEEQVVLEAVPAAPLPDQLILHALDIERDAASQHDIQVLERDMVGVRAVQGRSVSVSARRSPSNPTRAR